MVIDKNTIFWVFMLLQVVGATAYGLTLRRHPHLGGPGWWAAGCVAAMFGFAGILLAGRIPDFLALNLANTLIMGATFCLWLGLRAFYGGSAPLRWVLVMLLFATALHLAFTLVWPSLAARTMVVSAVNGLGSMLALGVLLTRRKSSVQIEVNLLRFFLLMDVLLHLARSIGALTMPAPGSYAAPNPLEGAFLLTFVISAIGRLILFISLISGRLQDERTEAEEKIQHLAYHDLLTQLPNRRLLLDRLGIAQADSARSKQMGALLFIDLDNFKTLNDTLGHHLGDLLLQNVAKRLTGSVRDGDTVARLGGDEFVILLKNMGTSLDGAAKVSKIAGMKILTELQRSHQLGGYEHQCTASMGVSMFAGKGESGEELLKRGDLAMYHAKASGRNVIRFFDPGMQESVNRRVALESDLRAGIGQGQLRLYYQAQIDAQGRVVGAEALVRWQHPQRGLVSPAEFIPLAEESALIVPMGQWVNDAACRQLAQWATDPALAPLTLAVNISARQFKLKNFVELILTSLGEAGANPRLLKLELTESLLVDDVDATIAKMAVLQARGVKFSLDDFGTGYSSLSYLKRLPLDQLKIDQSFVRDVPSDSNDASIVRTIIALAKNLGLTVIAEGVETQEQHDFLFASECYAYQGYLFSRPIPAQEFEEFARANFLARQKSASTPSPLQ